MRAFRCTCGNTLFFDSTRCLGCGKDTGLCSECQQVSALMIRKPDSLICGNPDCGVCVFRCANFPEHGCNRVVVQGQCDSQSICDYCRLTTVIPDLSIAENRRKWSRLEQAKRRVLYILDVIRLEFRPDARPDGPDLSFQFKADGEQPVTTGHYKGCITINIREADDVEREKSRVAFQEPQRTLVGHLRHELGHFFWDCLIKNRAESEFRQAFGDENNPVYADAIQTYYQQGPRENWREHFVSAYAASHPWEDFAETFGTYLDMVTVLQTAQYFGIGQVEGNPSQLDACLAAYRTLGVAVNELNRDMGLPDLVPEIFTPSILAKLTFIHQLILADSEASSAFETRSKPAADSANRTSVA